MKGFKTKETPEEKVEVSQRVEEPQQDKNTAKKHCGFLCKIWRLIKLGAFAVFLAAVVYGGIWSYAKAYPWLEEHNLNFVKINTDTTQTQETDARTSALNDDLQERLAALPSASPDRVPQIVARSLDGVVTIAVNRAYFEPGIGLVENGMNIGTGFIVESDGIIVTNQHVVAILDANYEVILNNGEKYDVKQILRDDVNDIALITIEATDLHALPLGDSDALLPGQGVIAMGNPLGQFAGSVTTGVVSGLGRTVSTGPQSLFGSNTYTYDGVIQTDAAINPGNSGGPLLDYDGNVIGVNFATTAGADNISFALPISIVQKRLKEFKTLGRFTKPVLGVQVQMISPAEAAVYKNLVEGAFVVRVIPGSPAQVAGIQKKDIIHKVDGKVLDKPLSQVIQSHDVGDTVELELWRYDEEKGEGHFVEVEAVLADGSIE